MLLEKSLFTKVIENTPLVSIDLIIKNRLGQYLLGYRSNRPAQGFWFVPGGRIMKNESLDEAFERICKTEIGRSIPREDSLLLGAFDHFYDDFVFGDEISTHYVALGHQLEIDVKLDRLPKQQHTSYRWFTRDELLESKDVHQHSRWYV